MKPTVLELRHLSLRLQGKPLLTDIHLRLHPGRVTVLLGPNGAGKSTLFKCIAGDLAADGGIELFGRPRPLWPRRELARRLAVLPQQSGLQFPFLAREVVAMGRIPHDSRQQQNDHIVEAAMDRARVWHLRDAPYPRLSGGERQRVHFARVLAQLQGEDIPKLLLLDEPTSALDLGQQHLLLQEGRRLAAEGCAVLVIVHDLNLAARYGDHLVLMREGRISCEGGAERVLTPDNVEHHFGYRAQWLQSPQGHRVLV